MASVLSYLFEPRPFEHHDITHCLLCCAYELLSTYLSHITVCI